MHIKDLVFECLHLFGVSVFIRVLKVQLLCYISDFFVRREQITFRVVLIMRVWIIIIRKDYQANPTEANMTAATVHLTATICSLDRHLAARAWLGALH